MTDQFDFTYIGGFFTNHIDASDPYNRWQEEKAIWECRFCYALTNSPDSHYAMSHSDFDQDGHPPLGWVRPSELKIEGR